MQKTEDIVQLKLAISLQTQKAISLGNIINILLQISKIEAGQAIVKQNICIDELIFNAISEVNSLYPNFHFEVNFIPSNFDENLLNIRANEPLLKQAFLNLLINAVQYADDQKAKITFDSSSVKLVIKISNSGKTLTEEEHKFLFSHFFRGKNAQNKQGFGFGLVLSQRIFSIHHISLHYHAKQGIENVFSLFFNDF
ncbi:sensor histidine kinase [Vaginella massiliensis]|uniref:sensor histidine kinase n=1 Tax=Vaginella massiliensis TaxID=1816680 RepID=UPI000837D6FF|nr:HAMP domain-containing sensor histidine kinase [Vaginella massiliensis]